MGDQQNGSLIVFYHFCGIPKAGRSRHVGRLIQQKQIGRRANSLAKANLFRSPPLKVPAGLSTSSRRMRSLAKMERTIHSGWTASAIAFSKTDSGKIQLLETLTEPTDFALGTRIIDGWPSWQSVLGGSSFRSRWSPKERFCCPGSWKEAFSNNSRVPYPKVSPSARRTSLLAGGFVKEKSIFARSCSRGRSLTSSRARRVSMALRALSNFSDFFRCGPLVKSGFRIPHPGGSFPNPAGTLLSFHESSLQVTFLRYILFIFCLLPPQIFDLFLLARQSSFPESPSGYRFPAPRLGCRAYPELPGHG